LLVGLQALDLLRIGLVVCDVSGQLLATNRTAGEILRTRDGLELNSDGTLCGPQGCSQPLEEVVRRAAEAAFFGEPGSHDAALSVRRASGKRPLTLLVRSVRKISTADHSGRPAALVLILDSALSVKTTHAELRQIYGLTSTETHLANLLMEGRTLKDCCSKLGISQATARTHLKHLFKKTRVRCQSELVSLILRSVGLARLGSALTEA